MHLPARLRPPGLSCCWLTIGTKASRFYCLGARPYLPASFLTQVCRLRAFSDLPFTFQYDQSCRMKPMLGQMIGLRSLIMSKARFRGIFRYSMQQARTAEELREMPAMQCTSTLHRLRWLSMNSVQRGKCSFRLKEGKSIASTTRCRIFALLGQDRRVALATVSTAWIDSSWRRPRLAAAQMLPMYTSWSPRDSLASRTLLIETKLALNILQLSDHERADSPLRLFLRRRLSIISHYRARAGLSSLQQCRPALISRANGSGKAMLGDATTTVSPLGLKDRWVSIHPGPPSFFSSQPNTIFWPIDQYRELASFVACFTAQSRASLFISLQRLSCSPSVSLNLGFGTPALSQTFWREAIFALISIADQNLNPVSPSCNQQRFQFTIVIWRVQLQSGLLQLLKTYGRFELGLVWSTGWNALVTLQFIQERLLSRSWMNYPQRVPVLQVPGTQVPFKQGQKLTQPKGSLPQGGVSGLLQLQGGCRKQLPSSSIAYRIGLKYFQPESATQLRISADSTRVTDWLWKNSFMKKAVCAWASFSVMKGFRSFSSTSRGGLPEANCMWLDPGITPTGKSLTAVALSSPPRFSSCSRKACAILVILHIPSTYAAICNTGTFQDLLQTLSTNEPIRTTPLNLCVLLARIPP